MSALFALGALGRTVEIPSKEFWQKGSAAAPVLLIVGALATVIAIANAVRLSRRNTRSLLGEACLQLAAYVDDACPSIPLRAVGVHVWTVGGPFFARRLHRGPQFLLRERQESHVTFTKGKGIIGGVWESGVEAAHNLETARVNPATANATEQPSPFENMSPTDIQRTKRYKSIWPLPSSGRGRRRWSA